MKGLQLLSTALITLTTFAGAANACPKPLPEGASCRELRFGRECTWTTANGEEQSCRIFEYGLPDFSSAILKPILHPDFVSCYQANDQAKKIVLNLSFNKDGSANFDGDGLTATGTYKDSSHQGSCLTRLCQSVPPAVTTDATFTTIVANTIDPKIDDIQVHISFGGEISSVIEAAVSVSDFDGPAPMTANLICN